MGQKAKRDTRKPVGTTVKCCRGFKPCWRAVRHWSSWWGHNNKLLSSIPAHFFCVEFVCVHVYTNPPSTNGTREPFVWLETLNCSSVFLHFSFSWSITEMVFQMDNKPQCKWTSWLKDNNTKVPEWHLESCSLKVVQTPMYEIFWALGLYGEQSGTSVSLCCRYISYPHWKRTIPLNISLKSSSNICYSFGSVLTLRWWC